MKKQLTTSPKKDGTKQALEKATHDLRERVKELNCLYAISELVEKPGSSLTELLRQTVRIIPSAWQYPDIACARIITDDGIYESPGFTETPWKLSAGFLVTDGVKGVLEVCYREAGPPCDEGPFLKEEVKLAKEIAEKVGKILFAKRTELSLKESEERYRILAERVKDGVTLVQGGKLLFANQAFVEMFGLRAADRLMGKPVSEWMWNGRPPSIEPLFDLDERGLPREKSFKSLCAARTGRELWVEGEHVGIQIKGKSAVLSTFRDVTERVKQETVMKEEAEMLRMENIHLRSSMKERYRFRDITGRSPAMQEVYELILQAAHSDGSVTILGESGTGKELVARAIHDLSTRGVQKFVVVNCGAIPENLLESEFFGHRKGAFTSAYADKAGYLDMADRGSLFLDEIGELTLNMQVRLLRALDGGGYMPVGSAGAKSSDFRLIAATHRDLMEMVREGLMREDFFYRIHVIPIRLPPLRERKEDIPLLAEHLLSSYKESGRKVQIPSQIMDAMLDYSWPGNVREMQNVIRRYLSVGRWDLMAQGAAIQEGPTPEGPGLRGAVKDLERNAIKNALEQTRRHKTRAAQLLGISRRALARRMKEFGL